MSADFSGGDGRLGPKASRPPSPGGLGEKQALVPQGVRAPFCLLRPRRLKLFDLNLPGLLSRALRVRLPLWRNWRNCYNFKLSITSAAFLLLR